MKPKLAAADRPMSGLMMIAGRLNDYYACTNVPDNTIRPQLASSTSVASSKSALLRPKKSSFWTGRVDADQQHPRRLWQSFDQLLGSGRAPATHISAPVLHEFFDNKIAAVHAATAEAAEPTNTTAPPVCELRLVMPVIRLMSLRW